MYARIARFEGLDATRVDEEVAEMKRQIDEGGPRRGPPARRTVRRTETATRAPARRPGDWDCARSPSARTRRTCRADAALSEMSPVRALGTGERRDLRDPARDLPWDMPAGKEEAKRYGCRDATSARGSRNRRRHDGRRNRARLRGRGYRGSPHGAARIEPRGRGAIGPRAGTPDHLPDEALEGADLVIETIVEEAAPKRRCSRGEELAGATRSLRRTPRRFRWPRSPRRSGDRSALPVCTSSILPSWSSSSRSSAPSALRLRFSTLSLAGWKHSAKP